jgi:hypothetical protein
MELPGSPKGAASKKFHGSNRHKIWKKSILNRKRIQKQNEQEIGL